MHKSLLLLFFTFSLVSFSQIKKGNDAEETPFSMQKENNGISDLRLYGNNLAQIGLAKNLSLNFGPSYNKTSPLNFYELPVLVELTHKKWQFYAGGQINRMLDQDALQLGNRFESETFGLSIPIGVRYNFNKHFFIELMYIHNFEPNSMEPGFQYRPQIKNEIKFGAGYRF